jgi:hypothetical protein
MIRVQLPYHLQNLARTGREVELSIEAESTIGAVLDALENQYPVLRGTIRDQLTGGRRAFIRFFADGRDWSLEPYEILLPESVIDGFEPFRIVGAMAGG